MIPPMSPSLVADGLLPDPGHRRVHDRAGHAVDRVEPVRAQRPLRALVCANLVAADPGDDRRPRRRRPGSNGSSLAAPTSSSSNHQSIYDIPILFWSLPYQLRIIAKESLGNFPFLGLAPAAHRTHARRSPASRSREDLRVGLAPDVERALARSSSPRARAAAMVASRGSRAAASCWRSRPAFRSCRSRSSAAVT